MGASFALQEPSACSPGAAPLRLQLVLPLPCPPAVVLGVAAPLRVAAALASVADRIVFLGDATPALGVAWRRQLASLGSRCVVTERPLVEVLDAGAPALVLVPDGMPSSHDLAEFLADAGRRTAPSAWVWSGRTVALYYPDAGQLAAPPGEPHRVAASSASWYDLQDSKDLKRAECDILRTLRKETDGYLAHLDRAVSIALSRRLLRTPVTPNMITAASLAVGLVGAALLTSPRFATTLAGAMLLWTTCILDGCDGEVARLKLLATPFGAWFDVAADTVVHVAVFVALPLHVALRHPSARVMPAGATLLAGVLLSMLTVWWLLLRHPGRHRGGVELFYERMASRDFIYVIVALAAVGRLDWFLWAAAVGAHAFWLSLCGLSWRRR